MAKDIDAAVREVCASFPEAEEFVSHGAPTFRVRKGKVFAMYVVNHHGDGRVALWLPMPDGAQEHHVGSAPKHFFVPPYVGPRGWLGVHLDHGLSWKRIAALVREAYEHVAPAKLAARIGRTIEIAAPTAALKPAQVDRLATPRAREIVAKLRAICLALPETKEAKQFGAPAWQAGKKTFAIAYDYGNGLTLGFWVGVDQQGLYVEDPRYSIPAYTGHHGWIALDVSKGANRKEIESLARASYRHFALKRMLAKLGE